MNIFVSFLATLIIIFVIPIVVYGLFSAFFGVKEPEKKLSFFLGILIQKMGTSLGFVALFLLGKGYFETNWLMYSLVWAGMYAVTEIGQTFLPNYSKKEAIAGIISELIYFPLAGFVVVHLL